MKILGWTIMIHGIMGEVGWEARTTMAHIAKSVAGNWDSIEFLEGRSELSGRRIV